MSTSSVGWGVGGTAASSNTKLKLNRAEVGEDTDRLDDAGGHKLAEKKKYREATGHTHRIKVECGKKLDKNPHRRSPLIGGLPTSVTLINLK